MFRKISRMKSVVNPGLFFSNSTSIIPSSLCFRSVHFSHSKILLGRMSNPLRFPSFFLLNYPRNTRCITSLKPLQNPSHPPQFQTPSFKTESSSSSPSGEIHVIVGPMFAGKTTTLLRRIKTESSNGRSVAVIKSKKDTRYAFDSIVTHDGEKLPCLPLADLSLSDESLVPTCMIS